MIRSAAYSLGLLAFLAAQAVSAQPPAIPKAEALPPMPNAKAPAPAAVTKPAETKPAPVKAEPMLDVPPPAPREDVSRVSPKSEASSSVALDEFDKSIAALRQELESVRSMRHEVSPDTNQTREVESAVSVVQQRRLLLEMLQQLATSGPKKGEARQQKKDDKKEDMEEMEGGAPIEIGNQVVDGFALGRALYRTGDFAQAEKVFRSVPSNGSNEWYLKYLVASCLRKQKKINESVSLYQDVIQQSGDRDLIESARWQLANIRWQQSMDAQIKRLREIQQKQPDSESTTDPVPTAPDPGNPPTLQNGT